MLFGIAFLLLQEITNVYQQPYYFIPVFMALWIGGLALCLGAAVAGFKGIKKNGKAAFWLGLAGGFLLIYFLQWFGFIFAIATQNMTLTWGLASFMHLPLLLAAACIILALLKLKAASVETNSEEG